MVQIQFSDLMVNDWLLTVVVDCTVHNNRTQSVAHTTNAKCSMIQATFVGYMRSLFWVVLKGSQWCSVLQIASLVLNCDGSLSASFKHEQRTCKKYLNMDNILQKHTQIVLARILLWKTVESYWRLTMDELYMTSGLKVEENIASFTIQL